jgi:phage terminase large subunit-like protein
MNKIWTPHAVIMEPTREQICAVAARMNVSPELAAQHTWVKREEAIKAERANPLEHGFEPPIWKVCDALLGVPWVDQDWAERMRQHLTFRKRVKCVLILGGQRGSKSEYASKRVMKIMRHKEAARAWMLHTNNRMSVEYQQPLMWKYLPADLKLKKELRSREAYIKYTMKNGFSDGRFILPNKSDCSFLAYEMDRETVEGGNMDVINPDELVPSDWVETMMLRIAEKNGIMIITFTPVLGYNDTVKLFLDGAKTVKESIGFMLPKDGGEPDVARALGLSQSELDRMGKWLDDPQKAPGVSVWSRPEECGEWINSQNPESRIQNPEQWGVGTGRSQPAPAAGREFEMVPRVLNPRDPEEGLAVVYFHSSDNPYGNPLSVWRNIARKSVAFQKERFYGIATKMMAARFPKFSDKVHLVKASEIPRGGTNYHIVDPCSDRNWFQLWIRVTPNAAYVYREWPGNYYIPGEGVPGDWALTDGKKADGRMGPAQKSFGWGYAQYKKEIARLEGWEAFKTWSAERQGESGARGTTGSGRSENEEIADWDQYGPADELIYERYMDARFASVKSFDMGGMITLFEDIEQKVNLVFAHTSNEGEGRDSIDAGVAMINDALYFDDQKPLSLMNSPKLYICEDCLNLIFALATYTGSDGQKGACKDPVDCLRFAYLKRLEYQPGWDDARQRGRAAVAMGGGVY